VRPRALALALLLVAAPASATDPFEIQVYDGTANDPLQPGLELHLNYVASGVKEGDVPAIAPHHQTHITLEPSLGILPWWELGAYLQSAIVPGSGYEWAGAKLRSKFVTPPKWHEHLRLGANFEIALIPHRFDRDRWSTEIRPIAAWESARFLFAINPIVSVPLAGDDFKYGPELEPAAKAAVKIGEIVALGFEYYAGLGAIGSGFSPVKEQEHYLYEVADLLAFEGLELNLGVGEGFTMGSNNLVLKMIVGYAFETTPQGSATGSSATRTWRRAPVLRGAGPRSLLF
jgi:hypothetical protein